MPVYAEQKLFDGRLVPVRLEEEPGNKTVTGSPSPYSNVKEIKTGHERLTLEQLREVYGPNGKFRNV